MKNLNKKAFSLIELLVVIAIIGILTTSAIWIYTSQLEKARDATRLTDINALRWAVEQFYQDTSEYPTWDLIRKKQQGDSDLTLIWNFLQVIPEDPKKGQKCSWFNKSNQPVCEYVYAVGENENWLSKSAYELSIAFENASNRQNRASKNNDWGDDDNRYEHNVWGATLYTWVTDVWSTKAWTDATRVVIRKSENLAPARVNERDNLNP